jgi:hypothetical protein
MGGKVRAPRHQQAGPYFPEENNATPSWMEGTFATRKKNKGAKMLFSSRSLHKGLAACLLIGAAVMGFFGLSLLASAISGKNFAGDMLVGGLGIMCLMACVAAIVFVKLSRTK